MSLTRPGKNRRHPVIVSCLYVMNVFEIVLDTCFAIGALDIAGENKDTNLYKELVWLLIPSFTGRWTRSASKPRIFKVSKKGFVKEDQRLSTISTNSCMKYYTGLFPDNCVFYSLRVFLLSISHFPLSSPTQSVDLLRLDIFKLSDAFRVFSITMERMILQSEILPKIREFYTSGSPLHWTPLTTRLLHACA